MDITQEECVATSSDKGVGVCARVCGCAFVCVCVRVRVRSRASAPRHTYVKCSELGEAVDDMMPYDAVC